MLVSDFTVIVTEPIHPDGIVRLKDAGINVVELPPVSNEAALMKTIADADALITRGGIKVTRQMMEASPRLRAVGVHGVGCDHVDLEAAEELGKIVFNTPSALTDTVAEMTMALMLALTRRIVSADKAVRAGQWKRKYSDLVGSELSGKTIGIVGLGRIGTAVARRLKPFGAEIIYFDAIGRPEIEAELGVTRVEMDELLRRSDVITLHIPFTSQTRRFISKRELDMMKDGALLVNTARGRIIDQRALIDALRTGKVVGAALDVFEEEPLDPSNPLAAMDSVILTPHLGASSREAMKRMAVQVAQGVIDVSKNRIPENAVVPAREKATG
jgi:D-3-phosphoglycerate dehydrogenase